MCIFSLLFLCVFLYCNALWQELLYVVLGHDVRQFFSVVKLEEEALLCAAEYIRNYFAVQVMVLFAAVFLLRVDIYCFDGWINLLYSTVGYLAND
jgi:hypothetical protein